MPCLEAHHSVGAGLCSAPTRSRKTVKFIKISAAPSIDGNRSTATSCKFATTSQSASLTAPLGGEPPFCGGMEPRGILRRLRRLRADWIFFLILRKAQNCGVDTPRNPVARTRGFLAPLSAAMQKRHPKWGTRIKKFYNFFGNGMTLWRHAVVFLAYSAENSISPMKL